MLPLNHEESHKQVCSEAIEPGGDDGVGSGGGLPEEGSTTELGLLWEEYAMVCRGEEEVPWKMISYL